MAKSKTVARVLGVAAAVAIVGIFLAGSRDKDIEEVGSALPLGLVLPPSNPGPADVIALLGGLHVGDTVSGWKVHSIEAPRDRVVQVVFLRGTATFAVGILRKGMGKALAPISLDVYELGYGMATGPVGDAMPEVAQAVADRVRKTEKVVPVPAGM